MTIDVHLAGTNSGWCSEAETVNVVMVAMAAESQHKASTQVRPQPEWVVGRQVSGGVADPVDATFELGWQVDKGKPAKGTRNNVFGVQPVRVAVWRARRG